MDLIPVLSLLCISATNDILSRVVLYFRRCQSWLGVSTDHVDFNRYLNYVVHAVTAVGQR